MAGALRIGTHEGDRSYVEVNGGSIVLVNDSLFVGEDGGGKWRVRAELRRAPLRDGCVRRRRHCDHGKSERRHLENSRWDVPRPQPFPWGSALVLHAVVAVDGSQASAIHVLDYLYLQATADPAEQRPGLATLSYALDEHGVTPITIQSRSDGLRIASLIAASRCRRWRFPCVPSRRREDITLVSSRVPTIGTFSRPLRRAARSRPCTTGKTYRWALTYRGGASGNDLALLSRSTWEQGAPVTHVHPIPHPPAPLWRDNPVYPLAIAMPGQPAFSGSRRKLRLTFSQGGAGACDVYVEPNLNDSGPGSLRAAVEAEGRRIVVFPCEWLRLCCAPASPSGNPFLHSRRAKRSPAMVLRSGITELDVRTHDVVLRYFRIRLGDEGISSNACVTKPAKAKTESASNPGAKDCVADHLSLSWTTGKIITITT